MYDLTAILMAIAGCSASISAILGGFIASKLIAVNADRNEAETRLGEIEDEIVFLKAERDSLQTALDEDDALDFIRKTISSPGKRIPAKKNGLFRPRSSLCPSNSQQRPPLPVRRGGCSPRKIFDANGFKAQSKAFYLVSK